MDIRTMNCRGLMRAAGGLIAAAGLALACSSGSEPNPGGGVPLPRGTDVLVVPGAATKGTRAYNPDTIRISKAKQTTITWTNGDATPHVLTGVFFEGFQFSIPAGLNHVEDITGIPAGTWEYHCAIHPTMMGRIIITP